MTRRRTPAIVGLVLLAASCGSTDTTDPAATERPNTGATTTTDDSSAGDAVSPMCVPPETTTTTGDSSADDAVSPMCVPPATTIATDDPAAGDAVSPMSVEPAEALPGTEVELVYDPPDTERVPTFTLEIAADAGWRATHLLGAGFDDVEPAHAPIDAKTFGGEMFTRRDLTNDRILLPLDVPPGRARICTKDLLRGFCAEFEIVGDS